MSRKVGSPLFIASRNAPKLLEKIDESFHFSQKSGRDKSYRRSRRRLDSTEHLLTFAANRSARIFANELKNPREFAQFAAGRGCQSIGWQLDLIDDAVTQYLRGEN